jgi:hypothetical protein
LAGGGGGHFTAKNAARPQPRTPNKHEVQPAKYAKMRETGPCSSCQEIREIREIRAIRGQFLLSAKILTTDYTDYTDVFCLGLFLIRVIRVIRGSKFRVLPVFRGPPPSRPSCPCRFPAFLVSLFVIDSSLVIGHSSFFPVPPVKKSVKSV